VDYEPLNSDFDRHAHFGGVRADGGKDGLFKVALQNRKFPAAVVIRELCRAALKE
jgi:hypothetical protein